MRKKILVLGGYGTVGARISRSLAADPLIECVIVGRRPGPGRALAKELGAAFLQVDIDDRPTLSAAVSGAFAVIDACGSYQTRDGHVAELCVEQGVHYLDIADADAYVKTMLDLHSKAKRRGCRIVTGASTLPAVAGVLLDPCVEGLDDIQDLHVHVALSGTGLGPATMHALLGGAGGRLRLKDDGQWRDTFGWSEPERITLPEPLGRRRFYLAETAGLELLPAHYGARSACCRLSLSRGLFNRGLAFLGRLRRAGALRDPAKFAGVLRFLARGPGHGSFVHGGVGVFVRGTRAGKGVERRMHLVARDDNALAIAACPAAALVKKWAREGAGQAGAQACLGLLGLDEVKAELLAHDFVLVYS
jgi:saccharopine dehydrogenase-like NADP-dependent oxidoreductase